eukprot:scaffold52738_cov19-Tisochrysis_lutea.AAC.4
MNAVCVRCVCTHGAAAALQPGAPGLLEQVRSPAAHTFTHLYVPYKYAPACVSTELLLGPPPAP